MAGHDIIVIGTSAGGVETLKELVPALPANLPAAIFVVIHLPPESKSFLADILDRRSPMKVINAHNGETIKNGHIYVAPPDYHLMLEQGYMRVIHGPKENRHRPAVDPLFRSAARAYGTRVIGVVLTGNLDDGTSGLQAIKQCGGIAIVQEPDEAIYPSMPQSALNNVEVDYTLPVTGIAPLLAELAAATAADDIALTVPNDIDLESKIASMENNDMEHLDKLGKPSKFSCPECHGTLWEISDPEMLRFRCHVGHAFTADSLQLEQREGLEDTLWAAMRALQEISAMNRRLAIRSRERNSNNDLAKRFDEKASKSEDHAEVLRHMLMQNNSQIDNA